MKDRYEPLISVNEMRPFSSGEKYAAKVNYMIKNPGPNFEHVHDFFHEHWGKTYEEAEAKARAEADEWIKKQS